MTNKARNKKKSLCEKSMELVVNILKLSSFSLASITLRPPARVPAGTGRHVLVNGALNSIDTSSVSQLPGNQTSQEPEGGIRSYSQLMESRINMEDIDARASGFIERIREKNQNDMKAASKRFSNT